MRKTDEAKRQWALIEMIGKLSQTQGNVYDRQRVLYCADHRVHLKDALLMARQELKIRQDIYGYDALAWVLCRMGRYHEAQEAMHRAMARNTQDARLFYHSGVIDYNLGNLDQAKASLHRSLEINPTFHTTGPSEARALLSKLEGQQLAERKGQ
jgi:Tfp pilus assembly protein PilF